MAKRFDPKAKARKQKILAAGLAVVLLGVLVFQAPTILGLFKGSSSTASSEPAATPAPAPAAPAPVAGGAPAAAPAAAPPGELIDSDVALEPAQGQLVSFDRFESKDPFVQQIGKAGSSTTSGGGAAAKPTAPPQEASLAPVDPVPTPADEPAPTTETGTRTASISVNGVPEDVAVAGAFPESDPIFKLVSLKGTTARIGIVDGTYATGAPTITLRKGGKPVTLMNTADGTTYVLRLLDVG
jgi:pyruvate/2-oxoglutarate dehydrogenase complex dihydrolipoamide acyltransferase (E2) component